MTAETKLRDIASEDTGLRALLGSNPFRWYDTRRLQGGAFPDVVVQRVSTARQYTHSRGISGLSAIRMQFTVRDPEAETTRAVAAAIVDFLGRFNAAAGDQFASPPSTPKQAPNFVINQWTGLDTQLQPPVYTQILDARIYNREDL